MKEERVGLERMKTAKPVLMFLILITISLLTFPLQVNPAQAAAQPTALSYPYSGQIDYGSTSSSYMPWAQKEAAVPAFMSLSNDYGGTYESIGKSSSPNNWDIIMFKLGNPNGGTVMIDSLMHGNEFYTYEVLHSLVSWLLTSGDADAKRILQNNQLLVIPCVDYRWGRTNYNIPSWMTADDPAMDGDECGVNLNRNFSPGWPSSLSRSNSDSYSGTVADSEKESQAVIYAWNTYQPRIYWNLHSGAGPTTWAAAATTQAKEDANKVRSLLPEIQQNLGITSGWTFSVGEGLGGGMAMDGAAKAGSAGFLTEVMSGWDNSASKRTSLTSGSTFKQAKAMLIAMCRAVENPESPPPIGYELTITSTTGGTTTPAPGTITYVSEARVSVTAIPNTNYTLDHWELDGENIGTGNPTTITMTQNHALHAVFTEKPSTPPPPVSNTTFQEDFESATINLWNGSVQTYGETLTVVNEEVYEGAYSACFTSSGSSRSLQNAYLYKYVDSQTAYARGYFYIESPTESQILSDEGDALCLIRFSDGTQSLARAGIIREAGGAKWVLYAGGQHETASALSPNRWYCIELHWNAVDGVAEMLVDGEVTLKLTVSDSYKLTAKSVDFGIISATSVQNRITVYGDYFEICLTAPMIPESSIGAFTVLFVATLVTLGIVRTSMKSKGAKRRPAGKNQPLT